jgi:hypothetical protein
MTQIKRRQFLQFGGSAIAAMGMSQFDLLNMGDRYGKVLAQNTPRKLALLIGANAYPDAPLYGCVTDTELQYQLLVHRFGFNPKDILIVNDNTAIKPTREGILQSFEEHLIKQAKAGDVVVFHYSGHGSRVKDLDTADGLNSTFVPIDRTVKQVGNNFEVSDIMGRTLFLLMSAIKTDNFTAVLDSCHSGGGKRGNSRIRAITRTNITGSNDIPSQMELEYQKQWLGKLRLSSEEFKLRRLAIAKGTVIASANRSQFAIDASFSGFSAGAFTYYMTKYLWQQTGDTYLTSAIADISLRTTRDHDQDPEVECKATCKAGDTDNKALFYNLPSAVPSAEAAIIKVEGKQATFWMGGIDANNALGKDSIFAIVDKKDGKSLATLRLDERNGLTAKGTFIDGDTSAIKEGALLREEVRGIPNDLSLNIGIDPSLGNVANIQKALQGINRIKTVELGTGEVDFILGKVEESDRPRLQRSLTNVPALASIGLFSPSKERAIDDSFGIAGESPEVAIGRLKSKFKLLLASKVLQSLLNPRSSKLNVQVNIHPVGRAGQPFGRAGTSRSSNTIATKAIDFSQKVKPGTNLQVSIKNSERQDLYVGVLAISSSGDLTLLYPLDYSAAEDAALLKSGDTLQVPRAGRDKFDFEVYGSSNTFDILVLASVQPLRNALKGLNKIRGERGVARTVDDPEDMINGLLGDLTNATRTAGINIKRRDVSTMDMNTLAALSVTIRVE